MSSWLQRGFQRRVQTWSKDVSKVVFCSEAGGARGPLMKREKLRATCTRQETEGLSSHRTGAARVAEREEVVVGGREVAQPVLQLSHQWSVQGRNTLQIVCEQRRLRPLPWFAR